MMEKCRSCRNFLWKLNNCKFCSYEHIDNKNDWDILDLDDEEEWSFLQIQYRLKDKGIDCLQVINWFDGNVVILIGVRAYPEKVARALNVHQAVISDDSDIGIMVINLFQEKYVRGLV